MSVRQFIHLVETHSHGRLLWLTVGAPRARQILQHDAPQLAMRSGKFGRGIYLQTRRPASPHAQPDKLITDELQADPDDDADVTLEYRLSENSPLLDIADPDDHAIWQRDVRPYRRHAEFASRLHDTGYAGVYDSEHDDQVCLGDSALLRFSRVFRGVAEDPLLDHGEILDEFALGGLARCTAVTCNALLTFFHKPVITLNDVPENGYGVLRILDQRGLAYQPDPAAIGHRLNQFVPQHRQAAWYLVTPGHALALIEGDLVDAEARGADNRQLRAAMRISRR